MRERREAIEEAGRRYGQADAGLFRKEARDRGRIAGVLLMAEREDADACGLRHTAEIRDRNARHAVDRGEAVELERVDDEVEAVGQLALFFGRGFFFHCGFSHEVLHYSSSRFA